MRVSYCVVSRRDRSGELLMHLRRRGGEVLRVFSIRGHCGRRSVLRFLGCARQHCRTVLCFGGELVQLLYLHALLIYELLALRRKPRPQSQQPCVMLTRYRVSIRYRQLQKLGTEPGFFHFDSLYCQAHFFCALGLLSFVLSPLALLHFLV
jgi:hypothetical protein